MPMPKPKVLIAYAIQLSVSGRRYDFMSVGNPAKRSATSEKSMAIFGLLVKNQRTIPSRAPAIR